MDDDRPSSAPLAADGRVTVTPECDQRYAFSGEDRDASELARGGIGRILVAIDGHLGRQVAIKELLQQAPEEKAAISQGKSPRSATVLRFLREARVTGQLEHPNIVPVYELGHRKDGTLYYAMRLLRGQTLADLLDHKPGLSDRLRLLPHFTDLCHAIAYAHSRGVIHRDVKPANVMVGEFGETVVLDWGLAKVRGQEDVQGEELERELQSLRDEAAGTLDGVALGTPAYMAPEQARGEIDAIDTRSDVWSLGAVLFELLTGRPPIEGITAHQVLEQVLAGKTPPPVRGVNRAVPAELAAICDKALRPAKQDRYSTAREMAADLDAFQAGLRVGAHRYGLFERLALFVRQRKLAVSLTFAGMLLVAILGQQIYIHQRAQKCRGGQGQLAEVWDDGRRELLRTAFVATGRTTAPDTYLRVARLLDAWATAWVAQNTQACEATHVSGTQSTELLDRRMACLNRHREDIRALVDVLADKPDGSVLDRAVEAASKVAHPKRLSACRATAALLAAVAPPADPGVAAKVDDLDARLARADALEKAGKFKPALEEVGQVVAAAEQLGYQPLVARALRLKAYVQNSLGKYEPSEGTYQRAALAAARSRDDSLLARIRVEQLRNSGYNLSRKELVPGLTRIARQALARVGEPPMLQAELESGLFAIRHLAGDYKAAEQAAREVLALVERGYGPEHPRTADALNNLGLVHINLGKPEQALVHLNRALEIYRASLGPEHPYVAYALYNIGTIHYERDEWAQALPVYEQALAIFEATYGKDSPNAAQTRGTLGSILTKLGRFDEAAGNLDQALAIQRKALGPEHPYSLLVEAYQCSLALRRGKASDAHACLEALLPRYVKALGAEHDDIATTHMTLAESLAAQGESARAVAEARKGLAIRVKALGADHPKVAADLAALGKFLSADDLGALRTWLEGR